MTICGLSLHQGNTESRKNKLPITLSGHTFYVFLLVVLSLAHSIPCSLAGKAPPIGADQRKRGSGNVSSGYVTEQLLIISQGEHLILH